MPPAAAHTSLPCPGRIYSGVVEGAWRPCHKTVRRNNGGLNGFCAMHAGQTKLFGELYHRYVAKVEDYCQAEPEERPAKKVELQELADEAWLRYDNKQPPVRPQCPYSALGQDSGVPQLVWVAGVPVSDSCTLGNKI